MIYVVINPETGAYLGDSCSDDYDIVDAAAQKLGGVAVGEIWVTRKFGTVRPAHIKFTPSAIRSRDALKERSTWMGACQRAGKAGR